jgi:hypothetical protein
MKSRRLQLGLACAVAAIGSIACGYAASWSQLAVVVVQSDSPPVGALSVGRGLTVDLAVRVHAYDGVASHHDHEPQGLSVSAEAPSLVAIEVTPGALELDGSDHLVTEPTAPNATRVSLTPSATGAQVVTIESVDSAAPVQVSLGTFDVDGVSWSSAIAGEQRHETELPVFVSSAVTATPVYTSGGHVMFGTAPLRLTATADDGTALNGNTVLLGPVPQTALLETTVGPGRLTLESVDASAIASLGIASTPADLSAIAVGAKVLVTVSPHDGNGTEIAGTPPVMPSVSLSGSAVHLESQTGPAFTFDADAPGDATATFTWAGATSTLNFHVQ